MMRVARTIGVMALLASGLPGISSAQTPGNSSPARQEARQPDAPAEKQEKLPPVPLFPRHRRGLYKDAQGVEFIDATPQSPPLATDDPGVPDPGEFEFNFNTNIDYAASEQRYELLLIDANYGLEPKIGGHELPMQLKLEVPVAAARNEDEPFTTGLGAAEIGVKMNLFRSEHSGFQLSVYPQVEFAAPGGRGVDKGLAEAGQTLKLPVLIEKEFRAFTLVGNAGFTQAFNDPTRTTSAELSGAIGRALTRKVAAMVEIHDESSLSLTNVHLLFVNFGMIHGVRNVISYFNVGHSLLTDDEHGHTYVGFGIKLLIDTAHGRA